MEEAPGATGGTDRTRSSAYGDPVIRVHEECEIMESEGFDGENPAVSRIQELGRALRHAREARGLTLRRASSMTGGGFAPSTLASYERGERSISLQRFCLLAALYRVPPELLLFRALHAGESRGMPLTMEMLDDVDPRVAAIIRDFIHDVTLQRHEPAVDPISLRAGDLEILASVSGRRVEDLLDALESARLER